MPKTYNVQQEFQGNYTAHRTSTDLMVHHAASLYSTTRGIDDVRAVARFHVNNRKWPGIGYHICLAEETQDGPIARYNCSDLHIQRAHIAHRNHEFIGIACLTNFNDPRLYPEGVPTQKWLNALAETLRDLLRSYPYAEIFGHKEMALPGWDTSCPGDMWHIWQPQLLRLVHQSAPTPMPREQQHYVVGPNRMAIVREGPGRMYPEALGGSKPRLTRLYSGTSVMSTTVVEGELVSGDRRWVHLDSHIGFIHMSALQRT